MNVEDFISEIMEIVDYKPKDFAWVSNLYDCLEYLVEVGKISNRVSNLVVSKIHAWENVEGFINSINSTEFKNNYNKLMED